MKVILFICIGLLGYLKSHAQFNKPVGFFKKNLQAYGGEPSGVGRQEHYTNGVYRLGWYSFGNSIGGESEAESLQLGLQMAFGENASYSKTKDGLYWSTGKTSKGEFFYRVYNPSNLCVNWLYSKTNDAGFKSYSTWLLSEVSSRKE